jgi:hypothetical protein
LREWKVDRIRGSIKLGNGAVGMDAVDRIDSGFIDRKSDRK